MTLHVLIPAESVNTRVAITLFMTWRYPLNNSDVILKMTLLVDLKAFIGLIKDGSANLNKQNKQSQKNTLYLIKLKLYVLIFSPFIPKSEIRKEISTKFACLNKMQEDLRKV